MSRRIALEMPLERGDAFEVQNADWIRLNLPHYERIWEAFIGHMEKAGRWRLQA